MMEKNPCLPENHIQMHHCMASSMVNGAWARISGPVWAVPALHWSWKWHTDMPTNLFNKSGYFLF